MSSPRVTVIIATYNWSTVLPYAIGSVLAQTMGDFELIVVGDGCTDDSEQVVTAIKDSRLRWINLPANTGHQAGPNNRGMLEARGEFIAYLGHDDLWLPHHLQCTTDALIGSGAAVAHSLASCILPGRMIGSPVLPMPQYGLCGPPSCTVHRREVTARIGGWRDYRKLNVGPEVDLFRRMQMAGYQTMFVPRLTVIKFPAVERKDVYRIRPCYEQAEWSERIRSEQDFEVTHLAQMLASDDLTHEMPARKLVRILGHEIVRRMWRRLGSRSGFNAVLWPARGAGINHQKKYKGIE
jgi:glycosyltransferase involved in cell wall biosynthesis